MERVVFWVTFSFYTSNTSIYWHSCGRTTW